MTQLSNDPGKIDACVSVLQSQDLRQTGIGQAARAIAEMGLEGAQGVPAICQRIKLLIPHCFSLLSFQVGELLDCLATVPYCPNIAVPVLKDLLEVEGCRPHHRTLIGKIVNAIAAFGPDAISVTDSLKATLQYWRNLDLSTVQGIDDLQRSQILLAICTAIGRIDADGSDLELSSLCTVITSEVQTLRAAEERGAEELLGRILGVPPKK